VWVFVNGKLAVDIGGVHPPKSGTVTIAAASAATYGLSDGKVYALSLFHAERKTEGSSFRLTLDGFNTARSYCTPICGDAIVSLGEQCDDGINDGGYGECSAGCVIGAYCGGDGIEQPGEDCDDGKPPRRRRRRLRLCLPQRGRKVNDGCVPPGPKPGSAAK
jgi:fibro-slime domain-containing protein